MSRAVTGIARKAIVGTFGAFRGKFRYGSKGRQEVTELALHCPAHGRDKLDQQFFVSAYQTCKMSFILQQLDFKAEHFYPKSSVIFYYTKFATKQRK